MKRKVVIALIKVGLLFLLIFFWPVWERFPGGYWLPFLILTILYLIIWVVIVTVRDIITLIRQNQNENRTYTRLIILLIGSILLLTLPFDTESLIYGKVTFRAYYEGTQNQATFKLREPDKFEIHHTGVFFYDKFYRGSYKMHGDTVLLFYDGDIHELFGPKVLIDSSDNYVKPIRGDSIITSRSNFYFGYSKGLN